MYQSPILLIKASIFQRAPQVGPSGCRRSLGFLNTSSCVFLEKFKVRTEREDVGMAQQGYVSKAVS